MEAFLRQPEAWHYVKSIADRTERLLTEIAIAMTLSFLVSDEEYRRTAATAPVDLLTYARAMLDVLRRTDLLRDVLDGRVTTIEEVEPFPRD